MVSYFDIAIAIALGSIFGSFSTFVGYRLFNERYPLICKRSVCCNCGKEIKFYDLIPIISFIVLNGKCRFCKQKIPTWHFYAEIFASFSFAFFVWSFGGFNIFSLLSFILLWCLITQSIIDYRVMMSSDILHLIELSACIAIAVLSGRSWIDVLTMMFWTIFFFLLLSFIMKIALKKDCLGFGDVKLFAILSALFSLEQMILFVGLCGCCGIILYFMFYKKKALNKNSEKTKNYFPFIPAISVAFFLAFYIMS